MSHALNVLDLRLREDKNRLKEAVTDRQRAIDVFDATGKHVCFLRKNIRQVEAAIELLKRDQI